MAVGLDWLGLGGRCLHGEQCRRRRDTAPTAGGLEHIRGHPALLGAESAHPALWRLCHYRADSSAVDTLVCKPNGFGAGCADWAAWQIGSLPTYPFGAALARAIRECPPATSDWARFEFICNCRGDICQWK